MEIISGIHQIKVPFPQGMPGGTNVYVVEGREGSILVDSGWDSMDAFTAFREGLKGEFLKVQDIKRIVITHVHADHYGLASKVAQLCGAKVAMHRVDAGLIDPRYVNFDKLVEEVGEELRCSGVPQNELSGMGKASLWMNRFVSPDIPEVLLEDGDVISNGSFEFDVLRTPGHSPGHICLYEPRRRLLFSGDHVLFDTTPHVGFNPQSGDNPLGDYISSLERMKGLRVNFVFPGHGPVSNSLSLRVDELLRHHAQRNMNILRALGTDLKTVYQIAEGIPWMVDEGGVAFNDLAIWDKRLAVLETISHLKFLILEGEVSKIGNNNIPLYAARD